MSKHNGDRDSKDIRPEQLTAYALGQLEGDELAAVERQLGESAPEYARQAVSETRRLAEAVRAAAALRETAQETSPQLRAAVVAHFEQQATKQVGLPPRSFWSTRLVAGLAIAGAAAALAVAIGLPAMQPARESVRLPTATNGLEQQLQKNTDNYGDVTAQSQSFASKEVERQLYRDHIQDELRGMDDEMRMELAELNASASSTRAVDLAATPEAMPLRGPLATYPRANGELDPLNTEGTAGMVRGGMGSGARADPGYLVPKPYYGSVPQTGQRGGGGRAHMGVRNGQGRPTGMDAAGGESEVEKSFYDKRVGANPRSQTDSFSGDRIVANDAEVTDELLEQITTTIEPKSWNTEGYGNYGREQYERIVENSFLKPTEHPLSTFSIDVDTASYSNVRRFLTSGRLPPPAAVRIEELINYFSYSYPQPKAGQPFSVTMHSTQCPWQPGNLLLRVGLKGKEIHRAERPPSNLVFLLDVSGSMADQNKLPLLKTALELFVAELTENDRVSIVTYAGEAGLRLAPTRGHEKQRLLEAIGSLSAGGSTHGSAGIQLAYEQAGQYFLKEGTNRVILATDGDLNVGITQDDALVELIKSKAASGTFLTVLGFGEGNLQDAKLEKLADNGNGQYAYIDSVREARKVLVEQMTGSTIAIAKDVKIQIEFNPQEIAAYRLLGYENRVLAAKDFNDDTKDAGEIGAGHTVTALYELVPAGKKQAAVESQPDVEPLKYQEGARGREGEGEKRSVPPLSHSPTRPLSAARLTEAAGSGELLTLKLRYKEPDGQVSKLLEFAHKDRGGPFNAASKDLQFAAAVASFGMILRGSEHKGGSTLSAVSEIASGALGDDPGGYRAEFLDLVRRAQALGVK